MEIEHVNNEMNPSNYKSSFLEKYSVDKILGSVSLKKIFCSSNFTLFLQNMCLSIIIASLLELKFNFYWSIQI